MRAYIAIRESVAHPDMRFAPRLPNNPYSAGGSGVMIGTSCQRGFAPMHVTRQSPQFLERGRLLAMLLALSIGILLIAELWHAPLTEAQLAEAGRGVIFVLLALGLMGTQRLSLILTALLCASTLPDLLAVNRIFGVSIWLECLTLILCMGLLLAPTQTRAGEQAS